ncbi:MAG: PAS domain S-box protein [Candidatus Mcinerneyibacterium aminivorans]|uniref:PAS domain S-box protein n=1 Tax=Candidatus Mcinerneyibacterium aminivorans TaxID=2703815 RepID=A0A5D0MH74_9BACT|nr:MAG: PAS domain S-box protein [Candidatus Mcinerneyibacterium aminivorans]
MQNNDPVIFTDKAKCEDCYRCLRNCPVKAIKIKDGQAFVDEDRCILCGRCINECPQNAKTVRNDIDKMLELLNSDNKVAVSVAPSYQGLFKKWKSKRIASVLRSIGFDYISETIVAASEVSRKSIEKNENDVNQKFATACPVFVNYIEKYHHHFVDSMIKVKSPMQMHGTYLKKKLGENYKVVFIGPCIGKKQEAENEEKKSVDVVITFDEFIEYLKNINIDFSNYEESVFDETGQKNAVYYPLTGGMFKAADIQPDCFSNQYIHVNGKREIEDILKAGSIKNSLIEPLFCSQGCISGPGTLNFESSIFHRKTRMLELIENENKREEQLNFNLPERDYYRYFKAFSIDTEEIPEDKIREVLARTGKEDEKNQLNCGACGYDTCREKAKAVIKGLAEDEMCIPYMRRLAEKRSDKIIEKSPNGIVILNEKLEILDINNSFKEMFGCSKSSLGKHISTIIDPDPMEKVLVSKRDVYEKTRKFDDYNLICYQLVYYLENEHQIIGVFIDITSEKKNKDRLKEIKSKAIDQAHELLEHQIEVAQKMTNYLGESTAKGEKLVKKLIEITKKESENKSSFELEDWL